MSRHLLRALQALPLIGALALLRWLPTIAQPVEPGAAGMSGVLLLPWRLDALTLLLLLTLALGVALTPLSPRDTVRALIALALLLPALLLEHLLALPLGLLGVGLLLAGASRWRWLAAAVLLTLGLSLLRRTGGAGWYTPATATALTSPLFLLLLISAYIGLGGYPLGLLGRQNASSYAALDLALQPIWLLPLLRTIGWGPWNSGWALATLLLGGLTALWAGASALWTAAPEQRVERIAGAWLGLALACIGLLTPVGIASALWQLLAYALGLGLLFGAPRWRIWAAPLPISATFVASWLAQGATAASGTYLLTGVCWLVAITSGLATLRLRHEPLAASAPGQAGGLAALSLGLGLLAPLPMRWLIVPAIDLLQGGLTPFGLLDIWPWIGLAALDSGQRRVAVLPSIAVALLALVVAALIWLLSRLINPAAPHADDDLSDDPAEPDWLLSRLLNPVAPSADESDPNWWAQLRRRVWWAGGARRRG
jgi:hypothetical protein